MAYSAPRTWTPGEYPTAAQLNQDLRDNVALLANPPACKVRKAAVQSIPHGASTTLLFDTEDFDTAAMHDPAVNTGRITCTLAGLHIVHGYLSMATSTDYSSILYEITTNGIALVAGQSVGTINPSGTGIALNGGALVKLAVGDYVSSVVFQVNGATAARNATATLAAVWVGLG